MSQNDYTIANQSAPDFRSDLNDALQALASLSSGSTAPSTTYANMLWYDTANNILKMRTEADDAWINVGYLDQSANAFRILDDTQVVNTSGTQTGLLGDQPEATWEAGTSTTESLVSPAKVKAAVEALAPEGGGLTLLGTLTTTSGATQTLSGLTLTDYKFVTIVMNGISCSFSEELRLEGVNITNPISSLISFYEIFRLNLSSGVISSPNDGGNQVAVSNASTSLTFSWSGGSSFDAGEILVYGEE